MKPEHKMMTLLCKNLTKSFDGIHAVSGIDAVFEPGRITGLIGPNGAGKTTLFHLLTGFLKPDSGQIIYCNGEIQGLQPWQIAGMGIGRLFQDVRVFPKLSVLDNVRAAFREQQGENPLWALLKRTAIARTEKELTIRARGLLEFVGLLGAENALAEELSYGQQKLLSIARLLANEAQVLLLDEPASGVNPELLQTILKLIRRLAKEDSKVIVVIEHNMQVVKQIADTVYFMDEGRIISSGTPEEVLAHREVREAYIGL